MCTIYYAIRRFDKYLLLTHKHIQCVCVVCTGRKRIWFIRSKKFQLVDLLFWPKSRTYRYLLSIEVQNIFFFSLDNFYWTAALCLIGETYQSRHWLAWPACLTVSIFVYSLILPNIWTLAFSVLSELPISESSAISSLHKSMLFHPRVAEEANNLLSIKDENLTRQLVQAIEQTNSDHMWVVDLEYGHFLCF